MAGSKSNRSRISAEWGGARCVIGSSSLPCAEKRVDEVILLLDLSFRLLYRIAFLLDISQISGDKSEGILSTSRDER